MISPIKCLKFLLSAGVRCDKNHLEIDWWVLYDLNIFLDGIQVFKHVITVVVNLSTKLRINDWQGKSHDKSHCLPRHLASYCHNLCSNNWKNGNWIGSFGILKFQFWLWVMEYEIEWVYLGAQWILLWLKQIDRKLNKRTSNGGITYPITLSALNRHCVRFFRVWKSIHSHYLCFTDITYKSFL